MKAKIKSLLCLAVGFVVMALPASVFAWEGDCGYEGGISSGQTPVKTSFDYQEVCFITGEPVVLSGTLVIGKSLKNDTIALTYTYNLKNVDKSATLTRVLMYSTKLVKKDNGQTVEETSFSKQPSEVIKFNDTVYVLKNYEFTRSNLVDPKPAINYYAGNTWEKKSFQIGSTPSGGTVTVEATGEFCGYDQYWGSTEVQTINYTIESEKRNNNSVDKWGGTASVSLSSTVAKQLKYDENEPDQISFSGGYVQTQRNNSILEYTCKLPEFDSNGNSTDIMKSISDSLQIETFPVQTRLPVPNLRHLRGHWAENDIRVLYSLEIFKGDETTFNPEQYITRAEFASAIVQAAKEVPTDPALVSKVTNRNTANKNQVVVSPFSDVSTESAYFTQIESAYNRGIISGTDDKFMPNGTLSMADAITIFIRALGLETMAPGPHAVTGFKDNDKIPEYARDAVYVAEKIGLVKGDDRGYLNPDQNLTKGQAAALLNRFISYMSDGITKDYRDRIVNY